MHLGSAIQECGLPLVAAAQFAFRSKRAHFRNAVATVLSEDNDFPMWAAVNDGGIVCQDE